ESGETLLCVRWERLVARGSRDDEAPQAAFDEDRRADGGAQTVEGGDLGGIAGGVGIALDAGRTAGVEHDRREVPPALWYPRAEPRRVVPQLPTTTAAPSGSARHRRVASAPSTSAISAVTAAKT